MTADQDLSARLAYWRSIELECEALRANPGWRLEEALGQAYRSGQLITIADHKRALQAAVARAVEAEREACAIEAEALSSEYWGEYKNIMSPHAYDPHYQGMSDGAENVSEAIRSRGVEG